MEQPAKGRPTKKPTQAVVNDADEERRLFFENLKSTRRGGQKAFTKEDLQLFRESDDQASCLPLPLPFQHDYEAQKQYVQERYAKKPPKDGVIPKDRRLVVTEYSLDHWLAQTFSLDLEQIPPVRPSYIPKPVYEQLKKYVKYGNINYDAQQAQMGRKAATAKKDTIRSSSRGGTSNGGKGNDQTGAESATQQSRQAKRRTKQTYIIYPRSMKVQAFVDQLEQHDSLTDKKHRDVFEFDENMDEIRLGDDFNNQDLALTQKLTLKEKATKKSPTTLRNLHNRSRNNNSKLAQTQSHTKMQRLPNFKQYQRPNRSIRNRIQSDTIRFLNPQEIEIAATSYDKYLSNMKTLAIQQQSSTDTLLGVHAIRKNEMRIQNQEDTFSDGPPQEEFAATQKSLNFNFRRTSTADKKDSTTNVMNRRLGQTMKTQQQTRLGSVQEMATHISSKILLQQNKPQMRTPFTNHLPTAPSQNQLGTEVVSTNGDMMRTFFDSNEDDLSPPPSSKRLFTPRGAIMHKQGTLSQTNHLERFKLTTIKSKLKAFRENDLSVKQDETGKLASILKRTLPKTSQASKEELSPIKLGQTTKVEMTVVDPFAETIQKFSTHLFPPHKSNQYKLLKTLETTNITEILEDKKIVLTIEEKALLSQRNHEKISKIITAHLDDEIDETKLGQRDNISINMVEITMDFNELQKRINDMNNPDFWLQKAIQKQKVNSVIAMEGAIDYYKQGLRINTQSEKLLYNIGCMYEKIGKFENAIRWFHHVLEVQPKHADSQYGLALCNFKMTRYNDALPSIQLAIKNWSKQAVDKFILQRGCLISYEKMKYFRALCFKKVNDKKHCQHDYEELRPIFMKNLNQAIVKYVFGMLMVPLLEDRKFINSFFDNFNELLIFYQKKAPSGPNEKKHYISQFCLTNKLQHPWKFDFGKYKHFIYYFLSRKSFFKRLPKMQAFSHELEEAMVSKYNENELVLIPTGYVGVVLSGTLYVLSHAEEDVMRPRLLFKSLEGHIIGHDDIDNGQSCHSETWIVAYEQTEIIFIKRDAFQKMWDYQRMNTQKQIMLSSISKNLFFSFMSQQLKYMLVYEKMTEKVFLPGEPVVLISKRSLLNRPYRPFFENRISKLRVEIEFKKQSNELSTGKKQSVLEGFMGVVRDDNNQRKAQKRQLKTEKMQQAHKPRDHDDEEHQQSKNYQQPSHQNSIIENNHDQTFSGNDQEKPFLFDNMQDLMSTPQCAEQDEEFLGEPYCQGVYIIQTGSINLFYNDEVWFTLKNGESFGESLILKQPSYEYFGNLVAGPQGAKCYLLTYDVLRIIPPQIIVDILELGKFQHRKEGLIHILTQKFQIDAAELLKY